MGSWRLDSGVGKPCDGYAIINVEIEHGGMERRNEMPTVQVPAQLTVEHLMAAVKQLSPDELREFKQQFAAWQEQNGKQVEEEAASVPGIRQRGRPRRLDWHAAPDGRPPADTQICHPVL